MAEGGGRENYDGANGHGIKVVEKEEAGVPLRNDSAWEGGEGQGASGDWYS